MTKWDARVFLGLMIAMGVSLFRGPLYGNYVWGFGAMALIWAYAQPDVG